MNTQHGVFVYSIYRKNFEIIKRQIDKEIEKLSGHKDNKVDNLLQTIEKRIERLYADKNFFMQKEKAVFLRDIAKRLEVIQKSQRGIPGLYTLVQKVKKMVATPLQMYDAEGFCCQYFSLYGVYAESISEFIDESALEDRTSLAKIGLDLLCMGWQEDDVKKVLIFYSTLPVDAREKVWDIILQTFTPDLPSAKIIGWSRCLSEILPNELQMRGDIIALLASTNRGYSLQNGYLIEEVKNLSSEDLERASKEPCPSLIQDIQDPQYRGKAFCLYAKASDEDKKALIEGELGEFLATTFHQNRVSSMEIALSFLGRKDMTAAKVKKAIQDTPEKARPILAKLFSEIQNEEEKGEVYELYLSSDPDIQQFLVDILIDMQSFPNLFHPAQYSSLMKVGKELLQSGIDKRRIPDMLAAWEKVPKENISPIWEALKELGEFKRPLKVLIKNVQEFNEILPEEMMFRAQVFKKFLGGTREEEIAILHEIKKIPARVLENAASSPIPNEIQSIKDPVYKAVMFHQYLIANEAQRNNLVSAWEGVERPNRGLMDLLALRKTKLFLDFLTVSLQEGFNKFDVAFSAFHAMRLCCQGFSFSDDMSPVLYRLFLRRSQVNEDLRYLDNAPIHLNRFIFESFKELIEKKKETTEDRQIMKELFNITKNNKGALVIRGDSLDLLLQEEERRREGRLNAISIHRSLLNKIEEIASPNVSYVKVNGKSKKFSLGNLQKYINKKEEKVTYGELPVINRHFFHEVLNVIRQKLEGERSAAVGAEIAGYGNLAVLMNNLTHPSLRVQEILEKEGAADDEAPLIKQQLHCIIKELEAYPKDIKEGELLSEQEKAVLSFAAHAIDCREGQEEGIANVYRQMTQRDKEKWQYTPPKQLEEFLKGVATQAIKQIEDLLSSKNDFTMGVVDNAEVLNLQLIHCSKYLKNLLCKDLGLSHQVSFDLHGRCVDSGLLEKSKTEILSIFYQKYVKEVIAIFHEFISRLVKDIFSGTGDLLVYNQFIALLGANDISRLLTSDDTGEIVVTDLCVEVVLEKLQILETIEDGEEECKISF